MFQLIGRERGEKRISRPGDEIKLGLKRQKACSPFSVTASNYPKQTQRCITVTNDFKSAKLVSPQYEVTERKEIIKTDDTRRFVVLSYKYSLSGSVLSFVTSLLDHL